MKVQAGSFLHITRELKIVPVDEHHPLTGVAAEDLDTSNCSFDPAEGRFYSSKNHKCDLAKKYGVDIYPEGEAWVAVCDDYTYRLQDIRRCPYCGLKLTKPIPVKPE